MDNKVPIYMKHEIQQKHRSFAILNKFAYYKRYNKCDESRKKR